MLFVVCGYSVSLFAPPDPSSAAEQRKEIVKIMVSYTMHKNANTSKIAWLQLLDRTVQILTAQELAESKKELEPYIEKGLESYIKYITEHHFPVGLTLKAVYNSANDSQPIPYIKPTFDQIPTTVKMQLIISKLLNNERYWAGIVKLYTDATKALTADKSNPSLIPFREMCLASLSLRDNVGVSCNCSIELQTD